MTLREKIKEIVYQFEIPGHITTVKTSMIDQIIKAIKECVPKKKGTKVRDKEVLANKLG